MKPGQATEANGNDSVPLGSLANAELRRWRTTAHQMFDTLWLTKEMTRPQAYNWMRQTLKLEPSACHIGSFDVERCKALVEAMAARD